MLKSLIIIDQPRKCNKFLKLVGFNCDVGANEGDGSPNKPQSQPPVSTQHSEEYSISRHEIEWDNELINVKEIENVILSNCKLKELNWHGNSKAPGDITENLNGISFTHLTYLNVSFNKLTNIDFLSSLSDSLKMLDVSHNKLTSLSILKDVSFNLNVLRINNNQIDKIGFLKEKSTSSLVELWCSCNKIDWQEFYLLQNLAHSLQFIVVYDNPATEKEGFYAFLYGCCGSLKRIDHQDIQISTSVTGGIYHTDQSNGHVGMGSPQRGPSLSMTQQKQYDALKGNGNFMKTSKGKVMLTQARAMLMKQQDGAGGHGAGGPTLGVGDIIRAHHETGSGNERRSGSSSVIHGLSGIRMGATSRPVSAGAGNGIDEVKAAVPYKVKTYKANKPKSSKNLMNSREFDVDLSVAPLGSLSDRAGHSTNGARMIDDDNDSHRSPPPRKHPHPSDVPSNMQAATIANNTRSSSISGPNAVNAEADSGAPLRVTRFGETTDSAISCHISTNGDGYCKWGRGGALACSYESRKLFASYPNGSIAVVYDDSNNSGSIMDSKGHSLLLFSKEDGIGGSSCVAKLMNPSNGNIKEVFHSHAGSVANGHSKLKWKFDGLSLNFDPNTWEVSSISLCLVVSIYMLCVYMQLCLLWSTYIFAL